MVLDVSDRFALWARNTGALHPPGSKLSLDSRIRAAAELQEWVCELLDDLIEALDDLLDILSGVTENRLIHPEAYDMDVNLGSLPELTSRDEAQEILQAAVECCRGLLKTSALIRKATTHPESEWLVSRLGRAITLRRQFLRYCRDHQAALGGPEQGTSQAEFTELGTKASTLDPNLLKAIENEPEEDGLSYTSAARSDFAQEDAVLELPSLQVVAKDQSEFECPLCRTIQNIKRENQWKRHAFSDLKPYVCTMGSSECDLQLFGDSRTWFEHELQHHRCHWVCALCSRGPFRSVDAFRAHVQRGHPNLSDTEASLLDQGSRRAPDVIPAADCPFCDEWEQKIRTDLEERTTMALTVGSSAQTIPQDMAADVLVVERDKFRRHAASHMEQLALFAIPRVVED
ncbi:hypothetical protein B0I37DRAFT_306700, partial [Chaetomium sp. MPI-CAGE-AT-0009]